MAKQTLGRWMLGLTGVLGIAKEIPSEKPPVVVETFDQSEHNQEAPETKHPMDVQTILPNDKDIVHEMEQLPTHLPKLKGVPETLFMNPSQSEPSPFLDLDHARTYIMRMFHDFHERCVDRAQHSDPGSLPDGTVGITVKDVSVPGEQIFEIRFDQVVTDDEQEKNWQEFYDVYFRPANETTELVAEPSLQDIVPNVTVYGGASETEMAIQQFEQSVALARIYLQAGMNRQEVKQLVVEKTKKSGSKPTGKEKK